MIRVGILGFGFMGKVHFKNWNQLEDASVVSICDLSPIKDLNVSGNIDVGGDPIDLDAVQIYNDLDSMLANEKLDVLSVTLPSHLHCEASIKALEAGIHVVCEKPMALDLNDCDKMIEAAQETGKHLFVAHCIRYWPAYRWLKRNHTSGSFGNLLSARFERLSVMPQWGAGSWMTDTSKSGGIALDLHIHDLDFILHLLGKTDTVESYGLAQGAVNPAHIMTQLYYPGKIVTATSSWMMPESFGFEMRYEVIFEDATVIYRSKQDAPLVVYPNNSEAFSPEGLAGDGYVAEIRAFADIIKGESTELLITPQEAKASVELAWKSIH